MDRNKINGLIGTIAVALSATTIIIMAELRTDGYNHFHKAVSELGSFDAPNKWVFNTLGYMIPGMLIALFSYNLIEKFRVYHIQSYPFYLLLISGLFMTVAGVFPADMDERSSFISIVHTIASMAGGASWLFCALTLWWQLKKDGSWKLVAIISFLIPLIMILTMSFVSANTPGLSQRIAFGFNYLYILVLSVKQLSQ